jgi:hypothetical protein
MPRCGPCQRLSINGSGTVLPNPLVIVYMAIDIRPCIMYWIYCKSKTSHSKLNKTNYYTKNLVVSDLQ